jgi:hypothetical protein
VLNRIVPPQQEPEEALDLGETGAFDDVDCDGDSGFNGDLEMVDPNSLLVYSVMKFIGDTNGKLCNL